MKIEAVALLPTFLYFFLTFSLLRLTQTVILEGAGVRVIPPSKVLVGSLIVAKALLTVDKLNLFARLERRPIIVAAGFEMLIYFAAALVFQYGDALYEYRHHELPEAIHMAAERFSTPRFWVIQIWLLTLLFVLCATREVVRRVGRKRFRKLFFG
jgi:hypothetical protein